MKILDIENWNRKEHYRFFSEYDEPFFGIVSEIDCTIAYQIAKENNYSFFAYYLHKSLCAANKIEEFKYRIDGDNVIVYDDIHASSTISRDDETFAFSHTTYNQDFNSFENSLKKEIEIVKNSVGLRADINANRKDVIQFSSIPWSKFTGLTHARHFKFVDSIPKITFGKMFTRDKYKIMPISVNVHHGLADGVHVSKYLNLFQELMDEN
ncbi:MAG: chloramphenicol acetyltransferase [Cyclobacteriaceae bacterium]|nr:chloramphenicol acetyltransferase [Cyclobacteriaceae bacterium]